MPFMFNLETAIATWRNQHKYSRAFKGRDLDELEQHLRDQVTLFISEGMSEEQAFRATIAELGSIVETESEYRSVAWMKTRDRREVMLELRNTSAMLGSYFRLAFRNLKKNRVSSVINIVGLSVSISVVLVVYLFASSRLTQDFFHENADEIFLIHQVTMEEDGEQWWGHTPLPLGPDLAAESAEILRFARVEERRFSFLREDNTLGATIRFVDPAFLDMFSFPLTSGSVNALTRNDHVILSTASSVRFFGEEDPIGRTVSLELPGSGPVELTVGGVAAEFPSNTDIQFQMLMGYEALSRLSPTALDDWAQSTLATFVQLREADDAQRVESQLTSFVDRVNAESVDWQISGFSLDNLKHLVRNRDNVNGSIAGGMSITPIIVLSLVSLLMLLLSCFNYMNISIATSTRRLKEIGVRKVVGSTRGQLVFQFLAENIELCLFSLGLGLVLAWQFTVPGFNTITDLNLELDILRDMRLWVVLGGIVLGTGLLSGAYPALYISAFRPTVILRGRERLGRRRPLTQAFLTFQFMLAFLTLLAGIVFTLNDRYHVNRDLGYPTDHTLVFRTENEPEMNVIRHAAEGLPGVLATSSSAQAIGYSEWGRTARVNDFEETVIFFGSDRAYLDLMRVSLKKGSLFSDTLAQFGSESAIVNETFANTFGLEDPIGAFVTIDSTSYTVAGVLNDFHYDDFFSNILPAVFTLAPDSMGRFFSMSVQPSSGIDVAERISDAFTAAFPGREARYYFQDETFNDFYRESKTLSTIFTFVATLALIISCMSIYALSAQNVVNRLKEIGIRKVLGGTPAGIAQFVNRNFLITLTIASFLSVPFGYMALDALLNDIYAYRMDLTPLPFLLAYTVIIITTVLTISVQTRSINLARPADIMRNE